MASVDEEYEYFKDSLPTSTIENPNDFVKAEDLGITTVTAKERPLEKIIQYVRGYPWRVDYFNTISSLNDKIDRVSEDLEKAVQSYKRYKGLTLYLDNPLDSSIQDVSGIEFEAIVNSGFIPFVGDSVVSMMVSGRKGLFSVQEVSTMTYLQHNVYKIKLKFTNFVDMDVSTFANLCEKVVQTYVEDRSYITDYGAPIILEEHYKNKIDLKKNRANLISMFLDFFYDKDNRMLALNANPNPIKVKTEEGLSLPLYSKRAVLIDEYLNIFFRSLVNIEEDNRLINIRWPSYLLPHERDNTILDSIRDLDPNYIYNTVHEIGFRTPHSNYKSEQQSVVFMSVDEIVTRVDNGDYYVDPMSEASYVRPETKADVMYPLDRTKPMSHYIFSKAFYSDDLANMTGFEKIVKRFLEEETILPDELYPYIAGVRLWSRFEQFYCMPMLIFMINYLTKETFSPM